MWRRIPGLVLALLIGVAGVMAILDTRRPVEAAQP
jgi:hypothetical protein